MLVDDSPEERDLITLLESGQAESAVASVKERFMQHLGNNVAARMVELIARESDAHLAENPWMLIYGIVACEMRRDYIQQSRFLDIAANFGLADGLGFSNIEPHGASVRAVAGIVRLLRNYHEERYDDALEEGRSLLVGLNASDYASRSGVLCMTGMASWSKGNALEAHDTWRTGANHAMHARWTFSLCLEQTGCACAHFAAGHLNDAAEVCRRVIAISDLGEEPVLASCYAHLLLARVLYFRNRLDEAREEVERAAAVAQANDELMSFLDVETALAHIDIAQGLPKSASDRANACMARFARLRQRSGLECARAMMAAIWMQLGMARMVADCLDMYWDFDPSADFDEAETETILHRGLNCIDFRNVWWEPQLLEQLRMLIHARKTAGVMAWLSHVESQVARDGQGFLLMKTLMLKALCAYVEGSAEQAVRYLSESLVLAEEEQCVRLYADEGQLMEELLVVAHRNRLSSSFLDQVLALIRGDEGSSEAPFGEHFTNRERDVMRLLCAGATNAEIAQRLYLSLSTIKNHTHSIYQKLGVRNRAQAIVRIRELGLV